MTRLYRSASLLNRLLALALLTGLTTAVAVSFDYNVLAVVLGTIAAGVIVDMLLRRSSFVLASLVVLIQIALCAVISYRSGASLISMIPEADARLYYYTIQFILVFFLLLNLIISIYLVRGRIWLNLLLTLIISDIGFLGFFIYTQNPFLGGLAAFGLVFIYTIIRFAYWRKPSFDAELTYTKNLTNRVVNTFKQDNCDVREVEGYKYLKFAAVSPNRSRVLAIAALPAETNVRFVKNKLYLNTTEQTDLLEGFLRDVKRWQRDYRVPGRIVLPVLYSGRTIGGETIAKQVVVHKRSKPDLAYGTVYTVNPAGLNRLLRVTDKLNAIGKRTGKKLDAMFAKRKTESDAD